MDGLVLKMNKEFKDITEKIKSEDIDVLCQSREIIDELLMNESERGKSVYTRTNILIAFSGALSGVLLFFESGISSITGGPLTLIYLVYFTAILFFLKAIIYSIKAIGISQSYGMSHDTIYEIQEMSLLDSLRHEIALKVWVHNKMIPHNTHKLFWVNGGLRNLLFGIISLLLLGSIIFLKDIALLSLPYIEYIGIIFILFALSCDYLLDRMGFWKFE